MNLPFKETRKKLLTGDFSGLFGFSKDKGLIHPSEVAKLFISIPYEKAIDAFKAFQQDQQLKVFPYIDVQLQKRILQSLPREKASYILNKLSSDDRTIFFSALRGVEQSSFIDFLDESHKASLHKSLGYPDRSVARIINTEFATIDRDMTIAEANEHLRKFHKDTEAANVIYVVDKNGKLIDDIPVRRFVLNEPEKKVEDILDGFCTSLKITDSKEDAVQKFKEYDRVVLPVINTDNLLLGVVTVDDVLDVTATDEQLGKTAGKDLAQAKATYPSFWGVEASQAKAQQLIAEAKASLKPFGEKAVILEHLADFITQRHY